MMPEGMRTFLVHWMTTAIALATCVYVVPGVHVRSAAALIVAALVLGFLNAIVRPILVVLTFPITVLTLGLFYFVVNGAVFTLTSILVPGFVVESLWWGMIGALVVSLISWFIGALTGPPRSRERRA